MEEYCVSQSMFSDADVGKVNPYALSARRKAEPPMRNNRLFPRCFDEKFSDYDEGGQQHFLDSCFLCKKSISSNRDIFMYRGDMPFCSEECRMTRIMADEAEAKKKSVSIRASSHKASQKVEQEKQAVASPKGQKARTGSILAG